VTVQLTKLVLFAQLAAVFGASEAISPLWQVVPLLVLIVVYWAYVRLFVPMASFCDMAAEVRRAGCTGDTTVLLLHLLRSIEPCFAPLNAPRCLAGPPNQPRAAPPPRTPPTPPTTPTTPPQILGCACDLGTFVCGIIVAVTPNTRYITM
jgi:hypothetical protein